MIAIEETATVQPNGCLVLARPEFTPGERVKVLMLLEDQASSPAPHPGGAPGCFFEAVGNLNLEGPCDWSEHLDDYLYRGKPNDQQ
jgi:hypothetical protein